MTNWTYGNEMRRNLPAVSDLCFEEIEAFDGSITNPDERAPRLCIRLKGPCGDARLRGYGTASRAMENWHSAACALSIANEGLEPDRVIATWRDDSVVYFADTLAPGRALIIPLLFDDLPERHDPHFRGTEIAAKPSGLDFPRATVDVLPDAVAEALDMSMMPVTIDQDRHGVLLRGLYRFNVEWLRMPVDMDRGKA